MTITRNMIIFAYGNLRFEKHKHSNMIRIFYLGKEIDVITHYDMNFKMFMNDCIDYLKSDYKQYLNEMLNY